MYIFVTGGKTMGHITPLLSIILSLKDKYNFIYFGLKNSMEEEVCKSNNIEFYSMDLLPFYRDNFLKNFKTIYLIIKEIIRIHKKFKKVDNKAIISSGGFVSIPLFLSLKSNKKILLESNTKLGLANKILSLKSNYLGVNFDTIKNKKKVLLGNPIIINKSTFDHPFFYKDKLPILFVGGSNGAFEIVKMAYEFNKAYPEVSIMVITGDNYYDTFIFNSNAVKIKRIQNLNSLFNKFSLVISRAGAATITELLLTNALFILVPSHNVSGNHQVFNAKYLESSGVCKVIYNITDNYYLKEINDLLNDENLQNKYKSNYQKILVKDSVNRIINLIEK